MRDFIAHFVRRFAERQGKRVEEVPDEVIATLKHYSWPGNVRELQNVIQGGLELHAALL